MTSVKDIQAPAILGIREWQELDYELTTNSLREVLTELSKAGEIALPDPAAGAEALSGAMNQLSLWAEAGNSLEVAVDTLDSLLEGLRKN